MAKWSVCLWRIRANRAPLLAEISYQLHDIESCKPEDKYRAIRFYIALQANLSGFISRTTKTETIYHGGEHV